MANPFLYLDEDVSLKATDLNVSSNPFFTEVENENPFLDDTNNPFAVLCDKDNSESYNIIENQPLQSNGTSNNELHSFEGNKENYYDTLNQTEKNDTEDNIFEENPPHQTVPNQNMQDLISTLTDQLDRTSTKLLGQIPATRTPSPVSMRDLHSPSPTPDIPLDDLLGVSSITDITQESVNHESMEPMFDLLGDSEANLIAAPKTKEDILSLFGSSNKVPKKRQPDFLCDEALETHDDPHAEEAPSEV